MQIGLVLSTRWRYRFCRYFTAIAAALSASGGAPPKLFPSTFKPQIDANSAVCAALNPTTRLVKSGQSRKRRLRRSTTICAATSGPTLITFANSALGCAVDVDQVQNHDRSSLDHGGFIGSLFLDAQFLVARSVSKRRIGHARNLILFEERKT